MTTPRVQLEYARIQQDLALAYNHTFIVANNPDAPRKNRDFLGGAFRMAKTDKLSEIDAQNFCYDIETTAQGNVKSFVVHAVCSHAGTAGHREKRPLSGKSASIYKIEMGEGRCGLAVRV